MSQARVRVPAGARAAVERARLTVVPVRRSRAPRLPFAVLVFGLLAAGVVGLLMFNTQMQQASFHATSLEQRAAELTAERQALELKLDRLRDPQRVAREAKRLGMVAPAVPAFIRLADDTIVGNPTVTTPEEAVVIESAPVPKPGTLTPTPIVITVRPGANAGGNSGADGSGNPAQGTATASNGDTSDGQPSTQGATR